MDEYRRAIDGPLPNFIRIETLKRTFSVGRGSAPFWFAPSVALVVGLIAGAGLSQFTDVDGGWGSFALYNGGADAARSFVELSATSLATITALTLSLTVISLQLASSQYSPRLIEHYLADRPSRFVISLFLGTFAFAIATLLNIRLPGPEDEFGQVPNVAIAVLVALLVCSLGALVFFVHRVTTFMRVESILRRVRDRTFVGIENRAKGDGDEPDAVPELPDDAHPVRSRRSGYYAAVDWSAVKEYDGEHHTRVWVVVTPGAFVTEGTPVAVVDGAIDDEVADEIESWLQFDEERWIERDVAYGVHNLVDVALTALSPGVNDPTTAITAIERVGETIGRAGQSHETRVVTTDAGTQVVIAQREWADILHAAVRQIVEYGGHDVEVVLAVQRMLAGLAWVDSTIDRRDAIAEVGGHLRTWIGELDERQPSDRDRIERGFVHLDCSLRHEVMVDEGYHL